MPVPMSQGKHTHTHEQKDKRRRALERRARFTWNTEQRGHGNSACAEREVTPRLPAERTRVSGWPCALFPLFSSTGDTTTTTGAHLSEAQVYGVRKERRSPARVGNGWCG